MPGTEPDAHGWLPIEGAPRDGRDFIGMDKHGMIARCWWWEPSSRTREWRRLGTRGSANWQPTHWQPLPSPPEREDG